MATVAMPTITRDQATCARSTGSMDRARNGAFSGMMRWLTEEYDLDTK